MRSKKGLMGLFTALALGCSSRSACAYLTAQADLVNTALAAETKIHVEEEYAPPDHPAPGESFVKKPSVSNDSSVPVYVRMRVVFSSYLAENILSPLEVGNLWEKEGEFYYYNEEIPPGQISQPLFTHVAFRNDIQETDILDAVPFEILVYAEAVCSEGSSREEAWARVEGRRY